MGFRINSSTELATYNLVSNILSALNNKSIVGGVFCDLTKAFDCVDYEILISKLDFYGIIGKANQLIKLYLSNRHQRVIIKKTIALINSFPSGQYLKEVSHKVQFLDHYFFSFI